MFQPGLRLESRRDLKESENFFQSAIFFNLDYSCADFTFKMPFKAKVDGNHQ